CGQGTRSFPFASCKWEQAWASAAAASQERADSRAGRAHCISLVIFRPARARITAAWSADESATVASLLAQAELPPAQSELVLAQAAELVARVRAKAADQ